jgi:G patch domain/KOW motif-containing protein
MESSGGKISFGFSKITKKPALVKTSIGVVHSKPKVELIDSIEGSSVSFQGLVKNNFKLLNKMTIFNFRKNPFDKEEAKLVIPMTNDQKTRPIAKLMSSRKVKKDVDEIKKELDDTKLENGNDETLEQRAAREIMQELQNNEIKAETKILELPIHPDDLPLEGATEATIDDYERIPIADFGKAMLRGMGWKEEQEKEKIFDVPVVRPKGLGLGADKVVKKQPLLIAPALNETLEIKRNACVKILAGKHKNLYGTVSYF